MSGPQGFGYDLMSNSYYCFEGGMRKAQFCCTRFERLASKWCGRVKDFIFQGCRLYYSITIFTAILVFGIGYVFFKFPVEKAGDIAAWLQAFGSMGAIVGSYIVGSRQSAASHQSAVALEESRREKSQQGYVAIVLNLKEEGLAAVKLFEDQKDPTGFNSEWNTKNSLAMATALKMFSSTPIYEMGDSEKIKKSFRVEKICREIYEKGDTLSRLKSEENLKNGYLNTARTLCKDLGSDLEKLNI
ncbi:hypothetical protein ACU6HM_06255 [Alcaligenes sp. RM2]